MWGKNLILKFKNTSQKFSFGGGAYGGGARNKKILNDTSRVTKDRGANEMKKLSRKLGLATSISSTAYSVWLRKPLGQPFYKKLWLNTTLVVELQTRNMHGTCFWFPCNHATFSWKFMMNRKFYDILIKETLSLESDFYKVLDVRNVKISFKFNA